MGFKIKAPKWNPVKSVTNLVNNPGKELGNAAKHNLSWMSGGLSNLAEAYIGKKPDAPNAGEDPNVTALRNRLFGEAQDYEKNLEGYKTAAGKQIEGEGNLALQSGLKDTKQNFNRRGLLYSGLREAGEQDVKGRVASTMASQKAQSNKELTDLAGAKYNKAAQVGLQGYQQAVEREAQIESIKLQSSVSRAQTMQQLGQLGGYAAGAYYGSRSPSPTPQAGYGGDMPALYGDQSAMSYGGSFGQRGM